MDESTETSRREVRARDVEPGDHLADYFDERGYVVVADVVVADNGDYVTITDDYRDGSKRVRQPDALLTVVAGRTEPGFSGGVS